MITLFRLLALVTLLCYTGCANLRDTASDNFEFAIREPAEPRPTTR